MRQYRHLTLPVKQRAILPVHRIGNMRNKETTTSLCTMFGNRFPVPLYFILHCVSRCKEMWRFITPFRLFYVCFRHVEAFANLHCDRHEMKTTIGSAEDVTRLLRQEHYIASKEVATIVYLAIKMERPVLVEGPAGVGKTELAKSMAKALNMNLIQLQCYEGIDETKAIYEWEYAKQLLYTQILKEKLSELLAKSDTIAKSIKKLGELESAFFSEHFLLPRPLLKSISSKEPSVLLIDEVDKPDPEFEAYLLEVLSTYEITIPEIGTHKAREIPIVFLTSNNNRDLSDALKRRCLHLFIDYPTQQLESEIVRSKLPDMDRELIRKLVCAVHEIRKLDIKKRPSISETIDWAESLLVLNIDRIGADELRQTLGIVSKYKTDMDQIMRNSGKVLGEMF